MASLLWTVFLLVAVLTGAAVRGAVPDGYILDVTTNCGSDGVEDANINIITDLKISAKAVCDGLIAVPFVSGDTVNFNLAVSYPRAGSSPCVFYKRRSSKLYFLKVVIFHGPYANASVHEVEEEFTVSCTFGVKGMDGTVAHHVPEGLLAPLETQSNVGVDAASAVLDLQVVNVLGGDLTGTPIDLDRKIWIRAVSSGADGEVGLKPVSCDAIGMVTNRTYPILRAGCGDGIVFGKHEGFTTSGLQASSPYFPAFNMAGDPVIRFECNFVMCNTTCNGNSCQNEF